MANSRKLQLNEQEYWPLVNKGDKGAFEKVFKLYYQPLCNYACSMLKDLDEAEEVVQNMFVNLWNKREQLQISSSLKSYLYRAVHNDCLNRIKHVKMKMSYADDYKNTATVGTDSSAKLLDAKELSRQIQEAIDELPQQCGLVFKMNRFDNLKYAEIAKELDISVKTVENHMGKALKILREKLKDYLPLLIWILFINE